MIETPGERLKRLRIKAGYTKYKLAKDSGVNRALIFQAEEGSRNLSYNSAVKLAPLLKTSEKYLLSGIEEENQVSVAKNTIAEISEMLRTAKETNVEKPSELIDIPFRGLIPCGVPFPEEQQDGEMVRVPVEKLGNYAERKDLYVLRAKGDSLEGDGIHNGQNIVVLPDRDYVGKMIYIVRIGNSVVARNVEKTKDGKYRLRASNEHYQDLEPPEIELLGRVITRGGWES